MIQMKWLWCSLSWLQAVKIQFVNFFMGQCPLKPRQHFNATYRNIVGPTPCFDVLQHVEWCWLKFECGQIFHATFVDVA